MKVHNCLAIIISLCTLLVSVARCESKEFEQINSKNLRTFEKDVLARYKGETVFSLREIKKGKEISCVLGNKPVGPASVQKLITTYAALKELSGEFKFHTDFIVIDKPVPTLIVKGYGDPAMTDERLYKVVDDLYRAGIKKIHKLVIDESAFVDAKKRSGINPYQAAQSALTLNFNTVNVRGQLIGDKKIFSTTSFSPLVFKPNVFIGSTPGVFFSDDGKIVEICVNKKTATIEDNCAIENPAEYFAEALIGLLKIRGIEAPKNYAIEKFNTELEPTVISYSRDLAGILADMNRYSSNFIAGQITYQLGRDEKDKMSFERGLKVLGKYSEGETVLADGSGLSKDNRLTASGLSKVIANAMSDQAIAADFQASLSRFGRRGTLKRRVLNFPGEEKIWAKTGTIDGVSSIAGTIELKDTTLAAFVIITNGPVSKSESTSREDFILRSFLAADINCPS